MKRSAQYVTRDLSALFHVRMSTEILTLMGVSAQPVLRLFQANGSGKNGLNMKEVGTDVMSSLKSSGILGENTS